MDRGNLVRHSVYTMMERAVLNSQIKEITMLDTYHNINEQGEKQRLPKFVQSIQNEDITIAALRNPQYRENAFGTKCLILSQAQVESLVKQFDHFAK